MQFDEPKVIGALNAGWSWILPAIDTVIAVNSMGNVMLRDMEQRHWRVCPEELSAEMFARTPNELQAAYGDPGLRADWQMTTLVSELVDQYGEPNTGECFGLVVPAVLGGEYSTTNIRRRDLCEYLRFTGEVAKQTKDLKDGETLKFEFV